MPRPDAFLRALYSDLAKHAEAIAVTEATLERQKTHRDHMIAAAIRAGATERAAAHAAGLSGPRVHQIKKRDAPPSIRASGEEPG